MPTWLWTGFEVFINLVEITGTVYFAWFLLKGSANIPFLRGSSVAFILLGTTWLSIYLFIDAAFYEDVLPIVVTFIVYALFVLRAKWYWAFLWSAVNMLLLGITAYTVPALLGTLLNVPFEAFFVRESTRLLSMMVAHILWIGLLVMVIRLHKPSQKNYFPRKGSWVFPAVPIFSIAFIVVLMQYEFVLKDESISALMPAMVGFGLLLINVGVLYLYNEMARQAEEAVVLHAQNQLGTMAKHHQEELQEITQEMRRFRHDFNNHVQALLGLVNNKNNVKLHAYLNNLADEISSFSEYIVTGNTVLDALLSGNVSLAKKKDTPVMVDAAVPEKLSISDQHLCILMGNLFNNALDANLKIGDASKRFIDIRMRVENENFIIVIKNATDGTEKRWGGRFVTTKKNMQSHGFGLITIDHILSTYHGYCERLHENNVFSTQIILPLASLPRRK